MLGNLKLIDYNLEIIKLRERRTKMFSLLFYLHCYCNIIDRVRDIYIDFRKTTLSFNINSLKA